MPQIFYLFEGESNKIANLANLVSVLKYTFEYYLWIGFYFVDTENRTELVIGPYQGKVPCTRLKTGKGVCWTAVQKKETIVVEDVNDFQGHIACDSDAKSEIVVPVIKNDKVIAVLDIDSNIIASFDETDKKYLEELIKKITYIF
ncbi:MAG: GAF domain-containing protein [Ignavibacteriae bacterium]|nr:GAF domain-containing protein [Ignavibacteriota bacterium]